MWISLLRYADGISDNIIPVMLVAAAVAALIIFGVSNPKFRKEFVNWRRADLPVPPPLNNQIRPVSEAEGEYILTSITACLATEGYLPQSTSGGFHIYQRQKRADPLTAILLLFLCLIPGIVYLVTAGKGVSIISVQTVPNEHGAVLDIKAPVHLQQKILRQVEPYLTHS